MTDFRRPPSLSPHQETHALAGSEQTLYSRWPRYAPVTHGDNPIDAAIATARAMIANDRSPNTLDKYARDFAIFATWVAQHRPTDQITPTHPALLGMYIGDLHNRGLTKSRILSYIAAIQYANEMIGHTIRVDEGALQRQIRGLRRTRDTDRQNRPALLREDATNILLEIGRPQTVFACRDRAILAIGWTTALRRSSIAALRLKDVVLGYDAVYHSRYIEIFIRESKTDQEGIGRYLAITEMPGDHPLCAVRAFEMWVTQAGIEHEPELPLFRTFTQAHDPRRRRITTSGISGREVTLTLKRLAKATGRDSAILAAHAMRRGFATSADSEGVRRSVIREHGGWRSDAMLDRYTRVNLARDNAIAEMFGRKKT